jgi:hypothetical protein
MTFDLIAPDEYDELPDDPEPRFAALEAICRRSMYAMISEDTTPDFDRTVRMQYMATLAAAADELGINGINYPEHFSDPSEGFEAFSLAASGMVTRIRLRHSSNQSSSVRLSARTRALIELQLRTLRETIEQAGMPEGKRAELLRRLDGLESELMKSRVRFGVFFAGLAFISFGVSEGTSFLANAPEAIATITSLLGKDSVAEKEERERLGGGVPRPIALPPHPSTPNRKKDQEMSDDDIPF